MMNFIKPMIQGLVLASLMLMTPVFADMVVIVHPSNDNPISQDFLKNLYLGKTQTFEDGSRAKPLDLSPGDDLRQTFLRIAVEQKPVQYRRHWSKALFTGGGEPPEEVAPQRRVVEMVSENPDMIGYVDAELLDDRVKSVLRVRM